ncbi:hypothetical protein ACOME3_007005 [Neoechinorhynchus agilis]
MADITVVVSINVAATICFLLAPFLPNVTDEMARQLNLPLSGATQNPHRFALIDLKRPFQRHIGDNHKIGAPKPIFNRIDKTLVDRLRQQFSGRPQNEVKSKKAKRIAAKTSISLKK